MKASNVSELKSHFLTNSNEFDVRYLNQDHTNVPSSSSGGLQQPQPLVDEFFSEQFRKPSTFSTKELANELLNIENEQVEKNDFGQVWSPLAVRDVQKKDNFNSKQNVQSTQKSLIAITEKNVFDDHWSQFMKRTGSPFVSHLNRPNIRFQGDFGSQISNIPQHWLNYLREEEECKEWFDAIDKQPEVVEIKKEPLDQSQREPSPVLSTKENAAVEEVSGFDTFGNTRMFSTEMHEQTTEDYTFSEQNPYVNISNALEEGILKFNQGDYPGAVLCLESACRTDTKNATAWLYLGKAHAYNEQDDFAIKAFKKCLKLDSTNLDALTTLSCSYANECDFNLAFDTLKSWMCSNDKYKHLTTDLEKDWSELDNRFRDKYELLSEIFLKSIQFELNKDNWDADLQNCLGILMNMSGEFEKAADCFRTALHVKPNDAILWNRLGATLANGNMYGEAIEAYRRALGLLPGFVRARYNVGIACISLKAYDAAIEHFLTALSQQVKASGLADHNTDVNQISESIWRAVRTALILSGKIEHLGLVYDRNLTELNKIFDISSDK